MHIRFRKIDPFLVITFLIGLLPAFFLIHILAKDFIPYYWQAASFQKFGGYSYQMMQNHCDNPINSGPNARAPLVPFLMAISMFVFGKTFFAVYLPFLIMKIILIPLVYLTAKMFLPKRFAFLAAVLLLFIPKLQTYSFAGLDADIFVAVFYTAALYFYQKSERLRKTSYVISTGLCLGLAALSKPTGLAILIGFLLAVGIEHWGNLKIVRVRKQLIILVLYSVLLILPYLLFNFVQFGQPYLTTHHDRSLSFIPINLPSLIETIPLYLGISFIAGIKGKIIAGILLFFLLSGIGVNILKKRWTLILPIFITLLFISFLSTCLIGFNIPANFEFITILGFSMIPVSIMFVDGVETWSRWLARIFKIRFLRLFQTVIFLLLMMKFVNNYFTARYSLDFEPIEYYISLPTVIKHGRNLPEVSYTQNGDLRVFKDLGILRSFKTQFTDHRFAPFSPLYRYLLLIAAVVAVIAFVII